MNQQIELPVFVVCGANWTCEIGLDEDDMDMVLEEQGMEAATKAIEILKEVVKSPEGFMGFTINDGDELPYIGTNLYVYLKDTNPEKGFYVPAYTALGNGGFYPESRAAHKLLKKQIKEELKEKSNKPDPSKIKRSKVEKKKSPPKKDKK